MTLTAIAPRPLFAPVAAQVRTYGGATHRRVRPKAELVKVWVKPTLSTCCGHAEWREEGEDCGCKDVGVKLTFQVGPLIRGRPTWKKVLRGEVTLDAEGFSAPDWSWEQDLLEQVEALVGEAHSARLSVEFDIQAAVARKSAAA